MSEQVEGQVWPASPEQDQPSPFQILTGEPLPEQQVSIHKCAACDNRHDVVELHEYGRIQPPFTHWYECPTLGDPVPVTIGMMGDGTGMELSGPTMQSLARAAKSGRWMAVVFYVEDTDQGRMVKMETHTQRFPRSDFFEDGDHKGCLGLLREWCERDAGVQAPQAMQPAKRPVPLRSLNGNAAPEAEKQRIPLNSLMNRVSESMKPADGTNGQE